MKNLAWTGRILRSSGDCTVINLSKYHACESGLQSTRFGRTKYLEVRLHAVLMAAYRSEASSL